MSLTALAGLALSLTAAGHAECQVFVPDGITHEGGIAGCDDGSVIDVMLLYTPLARDDAGGTPQIVAICEQAVANANAALANSLVPAQFDLVHVAEIDYDESGSFSGHLFRLTDKDGLDGIMDEAHAWRDRYGADLVQLIVEDESGCGVAWLMGESSVGPGFESHGFSVARLECAADNLTTPHEFGHNLGCHHDEANAGGAPAFDYSYGWRWTDGAGDEWRSVMAYQPGTRVPHFSNPDVTHNGEATGVAGQADNALTIEQTAFVVANFRCSVAGCVWDLDASGDVGIGDLLALLADWGAPYGIGELLELLASWGPCA